MSLIPGTRMPRPGSSRPRRDQTQRERGKGYSWVKAPRYDGKVYEVGPLARVMASYVSGQPAVKALVDSALSAAGSSPRHCFPFLDGTWRGPFTPKCSPTPWGIGCSSSSRENRYIYLTKFPKSQGDGPC